jgi:hypothetical protein
MGFADLVRTGRRVAQRHAAGHPLHRVAERAAAALGNEPGSFYGWLPGGVGGATAPAGAAPGGYRRVVTFGSGTTSKHHLRSS